MKAKVLVTGATGFIGSHLIPVLVDKGYSVYALSRYVTGRYVLGAEYNVQTYFADLRDAFKIREVVRELQPDIVIHLAAMSAQSYSYDNPQETMETNLMGTVNLAEACLRLVPNIKHFVFAGTAEEYGHQQEFPIKEDALLNAASPYAASKIATDYYLRYMYHSYNFPLTITRGFNTYGRKRNAHFIVERTVTQMLKGEDVRLGEPDAVRDFLYVEDDVRGYLTIIENGEKAVGGTYNLATGVGTSIRQLVDKIAGLTGYDGAVTWHNIPKRPYEVMNLTGDAAKIYKELGWKAKVSLDEGLKRSIEYWRQKL